MFWVCDYIDTKICTPDIPGKVMEALLEWTCMEVRVLGLRTVGCQMVSSGQAVSRMDELQLFSVTLCCWFAIPY